MKTTNPRPRYPHVLTFAMLGLLSWGGATGLAAESTAIKINRTVVLNGVGDAQVKLEVKLPAESYTATKANYPNTTVLLRRLGAGTSWAKLDKVQGQFDDATSSIVIEYAQLGLARMTGDDLWEIALGTDSKLDLIHNVDNVAIFSAATQSDLGVAAVSLRIEAPSGAKDIQWKQDADRITYRFAPPTDQGTTSSASFDLDARSQIMSALASSYANEGLGELWVARSVLKNTGDQTLLDYRVHYRLAGVSDWSQWKRSKRVLPGQTIVDAFFPLLDVQRAAETTGNRPMMLEVEYEYRQQDGRMVREGDSRQVQLLGRNQALFSNLAQEEAVGFYDKYNNAPAILASFVGTSDPAMQELASRIRQTSGGTAISEKDDEAKKFLSTLYSFFATNNISCQAITGGKLDSHTAETLKYGRDVLQNRAGTCVDLAILYASVCEVVGLKPVIYFTASDCVPAVRLPGGQLLPVDMTGVATQSFAKAGEAGETRVKAARAKGEVCEINVAKWRSLGVHGLDLPRMDAGLLANYRFTGGSQTYTTQPTSQSQSGSATSGSTSTTLDSLVGRWILEQAVNGTNVQYTVVLSADRRYAYRAAVVGSQGGAETQETGTFQQEETWLRFTPDGGKQPHTYFYRLRGDELELQLQGSATPAVFHRSR